MKRSTSLGISVLLLLFLPIFSFAQQPVDVSDDITAANESFMKALQSGDVETIVGHYTKDARIMPPNMPLVEGKENIRAMWTSMMEMGAMNLKVKTVTAEGFGNTAIEEGTYKLLGPDGQAFDTGKYIVIWKKVDGSWKLHQDIFNSSQPPSGM